jgi:hypothetical protein
METKRPESRVVWAFVRGTLAGGPGGELPSSAVGGGPTCQWRRHRTYVSALRIATRTSPRPLTRTPPLFLLRLVLVLVRPPRRAAHWRSPWTPPSASSSPLSGIVRGLRFQRFLNGFFVDLPQVPAHAGRRVVVVLLPLRRRRRMGRRA